MRPKLALTVVILAVAATGCDASTAGIISDVGPTIIGLIFTGGAAAFALVFKKAGWVRDMLFRAGNEVKAAVLEVEQAFIDRVKAARAPDSPGGVEITKEEAAEAKALAIAAAKKNIGMKGLQRLARILGLESIDEWLGTHVEAAVKSLSIAQTAAGGEGPPAEAAKAVAKTADMAVTRPLTPPAR